MSVEKESILARADKDIPVMPYRVITDTVAKVQPHENAWDLSLGNGSDGFIMSMLLAPDGFVPTEGMQVRIIVNGSEVCGVDVRDSDDDEWREVYYLDEGARKERFEKWQAEVEESQRKQFEDDRANFERRIDTLPEPMKNRIARLRANNPRFDEQYLGYELLGLEEAQNIAAKLRTELPENATPDQVHEAIIAFHQKPWEIIKAHYGVSERHTDDTFGFATSIARALLDGYDGFIVQQHGPMAGLVGCIGYGCHTQEDFAKAAEPAMTEEVTRND